ncbi:MAG TPA: selenide, water dikinase SelD [Flavisolibacter sp.]|jgi:selenide,water dikinase|nr:selenide, water dikinase SelD [Flavisolibacter sp.]
MSEAIKLTSYSKGGGCGCKIAPSVLHDLLQTGEQPLYKELLVGNESSDDAAVYSLDGKTAVISTTDFFLPIVDDPYDFGKIAAANAISDVYAMGGTPLMAIAILGWPIEKLPAGQAQRVLEGGRAVCKEAGIPLAGGHTIDSQDPIFGLAVTGTAAVDSIKKNNSGREGDLLLLTKPIGVGILATALKRGQLEPGHYAALIEQLTSLNKIGMKLGRIDGVHAMTDVTGFGLLGHLIEMAEGSGLSARLTYASLKKAPEVDMYLKLRTLPDATFRNWNSYSARVQFAKGVNVMEAFNLLPDPQTNGGLLISIDPAALPEVQHLFQANGLQDFTEPIGQLEASGEKTIQVV